MNSKVGLSLLALFGLIFLLSASSSVLADSQDNPYLLNLSKRGVTIKWESGSSEGEVHWGQTDQTGNVSTSLYNEGIHEVTLECLKPDTLHYYKTRTGGVLGELETFYTGVEPDQPFMFVAFGDTRSNPTMHRLVVDAIVLEQPEFVLHNGDMVEIGFWPPDWVDFWDVEQPMLKNIPLFPIMGNHEMALGQDQFRAYFSHPNAAVDNSSTYALQYGNSYFLNIDVTLGFWPGSEQYDWFEEQLALSSKAPDIKHLFVQAHYPPYSASNHGEDLAVIGFRNAVAPLLEAYDIDVLFAGHDHNYQHSLVNGIDYIVVGGGGADLYSIDPKPWTISQEKSYCYVVVEVAGTQVTFTARRPDGTQIDSFSIDHEFGDDSGDPVPQLCEDFDYDEDGLTDGEEYGMCTDPYDEDTDKDGYSDGDEQAAGSDPCDEDSVPVPGDDDDDDDTADDDDDTGPEQDDDDDADSESVDDQSDDEACCG